MNILSSADAAPTPVAEAVQRCLDSVSAAFLQQVVEEVAVPRHFVQQAEQNAKVAEWIFARLRTDGYQPFFQGEHRNLVALPQHQQSKELLVIGAHYDSVPESPGADDNASGIAALLACARAVAAYQPDAPVCFVAFNREEELMTGSGDFVDTYLPESGVSIKGAHVLEMIGYCNHTPGSQRVPDGLPIVLPEIGDFLGIIANQTSNAWLPSVLSQARSYLPDLPVLGLQVFGGMEHVAPHLRRSDHAPFWDANLPATMWTDTSEFRNAHYHQPTDRPHTLDYDFLRKVTQLLLVQALL